MNRKSDSTRGIYRRKRLSRSQQMARVKSTGNKSTELRFVNFLTARGITGWRRGSKLCGRPDFIFPSKRLAIFVDGCFWHGHPTLCRLPNTNGIYWVNKIEGNKRRDREVTAFLQQTGWQVLRIWEHELKIANQARLCRRLSRYIEQAEVKTKQRRPVSVKD